MKIIFVNFNESNRFFFTKLPEALARLGLQVALPFLNNLPNP
jgi:hypothetical protein